jgi:hypothetical protein
VEPAGPCLGGHALARVARRGRIRRPQQHHHTRRAAAYTTDARFVAFVGTFASHAQQVLLPGNDLQDPATWDAPPLCTLKHMHEELLQHYDCTDQPAAAQPAPPSAQAAALLPTRAQTCSRSTQAPRTTATANSFFRSSTASTRHSSGVKFPPRRLPALRTSSPLGPAQFHRNAVSRSSSADTGPSSRTIRPTSANDAFDPALWTTFVSTTLGLEVPVLSSLPRLNNSPIAKCACKKHCMDFHGDHTATCTAHSGATKAHDWMVSVTAGHDSHTTSGHGQRGPTARRRGDPQLPTRPSGQPEPGLRPQHHP